MWKFVWEKVLWLKDKVLGFWARFRSLTGKVYLWWDRGFAARAYPRKRVLAFETLEPIVLLTGTAPTTTRPTNLDLPVSAAPVTLALERMFNDAEDGPSGLTYEVLSNSDPQTVTTSLDEENHLLTLSFASNVTALPVIEVRATDSDDLYVDHSIYVSLGYVVSGPPLASLKATHDTSVEGTDLRLDAVCETVGQAATVSFYFDTDNNGRLDPQTDELLGTNDVENDGWSLHVSTAELGSGPLRFFAQASDEDELAGNAVRRLYTPPSEPGNSNGSSGNLGGDVQTNDWPELDVHDPSFSLTSITAAPSALADGRIKVELAGAFADPNGASKPSLKVDWGDGNWTGDPLDVMKPTDSLDEAGWFVFDGSDSQKVNEVFTRIAQGYNLDDPDNPWKGGGITSSKAAAQADRFALGYALNGDYGELAYSSWFGREVTNDSVLVRFTYQGDADLSGEVTTDDFDNWKQGFLTHLSGWLHGDLDYSGDVTTDDFDLWKQVYVKHYAPLHTPDYVNPDHPAILGDFADLTWTSGTGGTIASSHVYADAGRHVITVTVSNDQNDSTVGKYIVNDAAPNQAAPSSLTDGSVVQGFAPLGLGYISGTDPHPIVSADVLLQPLNGTATLQGVEATVTMGSVTSGPVYYDNEDVQQDPVTGTDLYRFALQLDAHALATGRYDWQMTITQRYSDQTERTDTFFGQKDIVNRQATEFGKGWAPVWLDRLVANAHGVLLVRGDGSTAFFASNGASGYIREPGDLSFSTLAGNWTSGFTLTAKDKSRETFGTDGLLTTRTDRLGLNNTETYAYSGGKISLVTDAVGRETGFGYNVAGLVDEVTDFAGRTTTLAYDSGRLTSITLPDPAGGSSPGPETLFGYDGTSSRLASVTDADGKETTFSYYAGVLQTLTNPDTTTQLFLPVQAAALADLEAGSGTEQCPSQVFLAAEVEARHSDELHNDLSFTTDRFGMPIRLTDRLGNITDYERNADGQVVTVTEPWPDDAHTQQRPVTSFAYDTLGNLTDVTLPDDSTRHWTYDSSAYPAAPTSYTDELGRLTLYDVDADTGNVVAVQRVVGQIDGQGNSESDDVVTGFAYTTHTVSTDPPAGLLARVTDPLEHSTDYGYNAHGLLTDVTYAVGTSVEASVSYTYDTADNLESSTNELDYQTDFVHDNLDRLTSVTGPAPDLSHPDDRPAVSYEYSDLGLVTRKTVRQTTLVEQVTKYDYNDMGRLWHVYQAEPGRTTTPGDNDLANVATMSYTDTGNLETVLDPLGGLTTYGYDAMGRATSIAQPAPDPINYPGVYPLTSFVYDNLGRMIQKTDPLVHTTQYAYENFGRQVTVTQPNPNGSGSGPVWAYEYDAGGNLIEVTDPLSNTTTFSYDELGRPAQAEGNPVGSGPMLGPVFDKAGNVVSDTDMLGNVTDFVYDARNRLTEKDLPSPDGSAARPVYAYAYNDDGTLDYQTDPDGNVTTFGYDHMGRQISVSQPNPLTGAAGGPTTEFAFDLAGNLLSVTDPLTHDTSFTYDVLGNRLSATDPLTGLTTYTHDRMGRLLTLTDPEQNQTTWTYDALGRVTQEENELGKSRYHTYDLAGNLTGYEDRNGRSIAFTYDNLNRKTQEDWYDGGPVNTLHFGYDALGRLTSAYDTAGVYDYQYVYNGPGSVTASTAAILGGPTVSFTATYNDNGQRTSLSATVDETADFVNTYGYDHLGRMTSIDQDAQPGGNAVTHKAVEFGYDADSRLSTIQRYVDAGGPTMQAVADTGYSFDHASRLVGLTHTLAGDPPGTISFGWTLDDAGRVTQFTSPDGTRDYAYDNADQLTAVTSGETTLESHEYDANGNRTEGDYQTDANNRLASDGTYQYTYDDEGNRTSRYQLDEYDNQFDITTYQWDNRNRLTMVSHYPTAYDQGIENPDKQVTYAYDAFDRQVGRDVTVGDPQSERYVYDGVHIALVLDGEGAVVERELYGPAVDQILATEGAGEGGQVRWMLADNQGTVRDVAVYDAVLGETTVLDHLVYDGFGKITDQTAPAAEPRCTYTGRQWDAEAGMYYYRARWYDPGTGRFASEDPDGFAAGDANLVRYCGNSATNYVDPSGMDREGVVAETVDGIVALSTVEVQNQYALKYNRFSLANELAREQGLGPVYGTYNNVGGTIGQGVEGGVIAGTTALGTVVPGVNVVPAAIYAEKGEYGKAALYSLPVVGPTMVGVMSRFGSGGGRFLVRMAKNLFGFGGREAAAEAGAGERFATNLAPRAKAPGGSAQTGGGGSRVLNEIAEGGRTEASAVNGAPSAANQAAQAANRLHHSWPQYLGGAVKQKLQGLPKATHDAYHSGLDKILPRQIRGGATDYYRSLSPAEQAANFQKFMEYTKAFDAKHGTRLWDAVVDEATRIR